MILSNSKHIKYLEAALDPRCTEEEKAFLGYMASLAAAREPVTREEYLRAEAILGGTRCSLTTPLYMRPFPQ